ncbi:hypothetical protein [Amycolatopsis sp. cmx-11-12]|uniref:hypothetical protein n=1 Tax=Amycolatopsis sp. cmx-11-12 TaxID=2785795 RepID=UPI003917C392
MDWNHFWTGFGVGLGVMAGGASIAVNVLTVQTQVETVKYRLDEAAKMRELQETVSHPNFI